MLFATPDSFEVITKRLPLVWPSLTIVAVTPPFAALMASRTPANVLLLVSIVIVLAGLLVFAEKVLPIAS